MDFEDVFIVNGIAEKIAKSIKSSCKGLLVGWKYNETILVTGCVCHEVIGDIKQLNAWLPEGIYICGTFSDDENHENATSEESYIHIWLTENDSLQCLLDNAKLINVQKIPNHEAKAIMKKSSVLFQTKASLFVNVTKNGTVHFDEEHVISENTAFHLISHNTVLSSDSPSDQTCNDLVTQSTKTKSSQTVDSCLQTTILKCVSANKGKVPFVKITSVTGTIYKVPVHFNALCFVPKNTPLSKVASYLRVSLLRQLHLMRTTITDTHDVNVQNLAVPEFNHFIVPGWCHSVSVCFPANQSDEQLADYRKNVLHPTFLELCTRPIFRRANAIHYDPIPNHGLLTNPHVGLKDPKLVDGKVHLLDGFYQYHHYMQDNFNDDGWGCAYRSLQSLVSWFRHQGYTNKPVPSHKEIQQILVTVGDKPKDFIGTKKWIGSIEVNNVLNEYLGVTSKIMFVSQGSELASRGRELAMHFDNQGAPIMIGGGVLAHTILGVCFSETTGDTNFLILDPHYTGSEDLKTVQEKGWCGWKGEDFWNQTAYYNLCLPQRPVAF